MGSEIAVAVALVAGLLFLLLLGLEIGWAIGIVAVVGLIWYIDQPISQVAETAWSSLNSFTLTAMPLFIFMGTILGNTGVNERLFAAIDKWFGHFPGGLAISVIAGNAIFGGFMTPTEAAALGAFLSLVLTFAYRRLTIAIIKKSLLETVKVTSFSLFIMAMATLISHVFNSAGIIPMIKDFVIGLPIGKYGVLVLFFAMYFFMGMFFDSWSMLFLTFPFLIPIYLNILLLILFPQLALWLPSFLGVN